MRTFRYIAVFLMLLLIAPIAMLPLGSSTASPVGYWKLDEGTGTTTADSSSNSKVATIFGATWVDGKIGKALSFDGVDDYVVVSNTSEITPNAFSISVCVKFNSFPAVGQYRGWSAAYILSNGIDDHQAGNYGLALQRNTQDPLISFLISFGGQPYVISASEPAVVGRWYYLVASYDGIDMKLYVDGQVASQKTVSLQRPSNPGNIQLGALKTPNYEYWLDGIIDEVSIWNYALTQSEITEQAKALGFSSNQPTTSSSPQPASSNSSPNPTSISSPYPTETLVSVKPQPSTPFDSSLILIAVTVSLIVVSLLGLFVVRQKQNRSSNTKQLKNTQDTPSTTRLNMQTLTAQESLDYVFISHVEKDSDIAFEIAQGLEHAGYRTWYYERDSVPGASYLLQTAQAIEQSKAMILLISPHSLNSNQVTKEVIRAHESGKPFIPILCNISHLEFQNRQPEWREAIGSATSITIPEKGIIVILHRLIEGLKLLGVKKNID